MGVRRASSSSILGYATRDVQRAGSSNLSTLIAIAPYAVGGVVGSGETNCWLTYTDGITGYQYRIHKFLNGGAAGSGQAVDQFQVSNGVLGQLLIVGGGGGGGNGSLSYSGGGGGGGAMYENNSYDFIAGTHTLYIGAGGTAGTSGAHSRFDDVISYGGGGGGHGSSGSGLNGGSGGGNAGNGGTPGIATYGSLDAGATTTPVSFFASNASGYTGGGAGGVGAGKSSNISGAAVTYASGAGKTSGGQPGIAGAAHTGSGGSASGSQQAGGAGANGIIILRYRIA